MKIFKKTGSTSQILQIFIADSSSTTGAGLTGLVFNTSSLVAYYHRKADTTATAISLVTMTVGTFTSGGFKEIDATNMPGWYQLCPPDACFATGDCAIHLKGAANMAPLPIEVQITAAGLDPDATNQSVTVAANGLGTSSIASGAIKEASFDTTGGSFWPFGIVDQGTAQSATSTTLVIRAAAAFADHELRGHTVWVWSSTTGFGVSQTIIDNVGSTDTLTVDTWETTPTGTIKYVIIATPKAAASGTLPAVNATQILGTAISTPATAGVLDVNIKNIGNAALSTSTAQLGVNVVNLGGTAQTGRDIGASVLLSSGTGTGQVSLSSGGVLISGAGADAVLTRAMTEAYSTDGATATPAQLLYEIIARLTEFSISGTTVTVKKRDGSTTALTLTLNDGTSPTSITRAS